MNRISYYANRAAISAFQAGASIRTAALAAGISQGTAEKIRKYLVEVGDLPILCRCTQPLGHRGWCKYRLRQSPKRKAVLKQMHERQRNKSNDQSIPLR